VYITTVDTSGYYGMCILSFIKSAFLARFAHVNFVAKIFYW